MGKDRFDFAAEEAGVDWEYAEGMAAVEDLIGFFVHTVRGEEETEAGRVADCIDRVEIDNTILEKEVAEDLKTEFGGEIEEGEGLGSGIVARNGLRDRGLHRQRIAEHRKPRKRNK